MADEDVTTEEAQAPQDESQVETAPVEAEVIDEEVVEGVEQPVAEEVLDEPVAETPELPRLTRDQLLEQYADEIREERNKARQERELELRRESGNAEATRKRVQEAAKEAGVELDEERANFMYDNAYGHARHTIATQLGEGAIATLNVEGVEAETLMARLTSADPTEQYQAAQQLVALSNERIGEPMGMAKVYEMDIEDVPKDSKLYKSHVQRAGQRSSANERADELEARPTPVPRPAVPNGDAPGSGLGPTPEEYRAATAAKRREWRKAGVEVRIA